MNRVVALMPVLLCALALGACGDDDDDGDAGTGGQAETLTVGGVFKAVGNPFFLAVEKGLNQADEELPDVETTVNSPELLPGGDVDVAGQIAVVEDMLAQQVAAIVIAPVAPQLETVLQRAVDDGVPVVLVDTDIPEWDGKTSFVGTDNSNSAQAVCEQIVEELGGSGKVAVLEGTPGVAPETDRAEGCKRAIEGTDIELVSGISARGSRERAQSLVDDVLQANPDLDALFGPSSEVSLGALRSVELAKKNGTLEQDVVIGGHDAVPEEIQYLTSGGGEGITYITVAQRPEEMGEFGLEAAVKAARDQEVEPRIETGFTVVTEENASEFPAE